MAYAKLDLDLSWFVKTHCLALKNLHNNKNTNINWILAEAFQFPYDY